MNKGQILQSTLFGSEGQSENCFSHLVIFSGFFAVLYVFLWLGAFPIVITQSILLYILVIFNKSFVFKQFMSWFSAIPKIGNKDTAPNYDWDNIFNSVLGIFEKDLVILPSYMETKKKKEIKEEVLNFVKDISSNRTNLENVDSAVCVGELIKLLRPGRTSTLLVERSQMNLLKSKYNGEEQLPYIKIELNYVDEQGRHPSFRLFSIQDYNSILEIIKSYKSDSSYYVIVHDILEKIELAAFCKGGDRRARWKLDEVHSEYGNILECHKVAAKLTYLFLDILINDFKSKNLYDLKKDKIQKAKNYCFKLFNDDERYFLNHIFSEGKCPMCINKIEVIDFFRNGRNDSYSVVFGHYEFRGDKTKNVHLGKNAFWIHRTCNYIQAEYTIKERIPFLKEIIKNQETYNINWDKRG